MISGLGSVQNRAAGRWLLLPGFFFFFLSSAVSEEKATLRIEPNVDKVPANHLKFYLHFSEPMERGEAFRYLRLVEIDSEGREKAEVPEPFREVELWDETFTRMTVWFHPGRQKPGVNLNLEIGPVLEEGRKYRLEISPEWRTESGGILAGPLMKEFKAGKMDEVQPDPVSWGSGYGMNGEGQPVAIIHTGEVLDPESARRRVQIFIGEKAIAFAVEQNRIQFPYSAGKLDSFRVIVDPGLEDLAGNSVARPFNLNLEENPDFVERTEPVEVTFPRKITLPENIEFP